MAMASDTLSISKDLRAAGFNEQQADALATHMAAMPSNLVTKEDLALALADLERSSITGSTNSITRLTSLITRSIRLSRACCSSWARAWRLASGWC